MKIHVKELTNEEERELTLFLLQSENTLLYTSVQFNRFLSSYLQADLRYLIARNETGEILGCLPFMMSCQSTYGKIANALPYYGSNGAPVLKSTIDEVMKRNILSELFSSAEKIIFTNQCSSSTFISNPLDTFVNEWMKSNFNYDFTDTRVGQITLLPEKSDNSTDALMKMFDDPRPRNIRKAMKSEIKYRHSSSIDDIEFLFRTHHDNISSIGGIPKEKDFFYQVGEFFNENDFKIYVAEYNEKKIAALLLFYYNKTVEYYTPAVTEEFRSLQPTSLLIYQAMIDAVNSGYKYWNWGGTWISQTGVYDFKKKWAAKDFTYNYYTKIFNKEILHLSKENLLKLYPNFFVVPFDQLK